MDIVQVCTPFGGSGGQRSPETCGNHPPPGLREALAVLEGESLEPRRH